jgi:hypothetical protein
MDELLVDAPCPLGAVDVVLSVSASSWNHPLSRPLRPLSATRRRHHLGTRHRIRVVRFGRISDVSFRRIHQVNNDRIWVAADTLPFSRALR